VAGLDDTVRANGLTTSSPGLDQAAPELTHVAHAIALDFC
jgi:hypothetical protein